MKSRPQWKEEFQGVRYNVVDGRDFEHNMWPKSHANLIGIGTFHWDFWEIRKYLGLFSANIW